MSLDVDLMVTQPVWHEGKIVHFKRMIDKTKDHFGVE